jgi:hypothetical protein
MSMLYTVLGALVSEGGTVQRQSSRIEATPAMPLKAPPFTTHRRFSYTGYKDLLRRRLVAE